MDFFFLSMSEDSPDGVHAVDQITKLNKDLGEVKFQQLTDAMDFIRCLFGTPGQYGCIVVCYLCSRNLSCHR